MAAEDQKEEGGEEGGQADPFFMVRNNALDSVDSLGRVKSLDNLHREMSGGSTGSVGSPVPPAEDSEHVDDALESRRTPSASPSPEDRDSASPPPAQPATPTDDGSFLTRERLTNHVAVEAKREPSVVLETDKEEDEGQDAASPVETSISLSASLASHALTGEPSSVATPPDDGLFGSKSNSPSGGNDVPLPTQSSGSAAAIMNSLSLSVASQVTVSAVPPPITVEQTPPTSTQAVAAPQPPPLAQSVRPLRPLRRASTTEDSERIWAARTATKAASEQGAGRGVDVSTEGEVTGRSYG